MQFENKEIYTESPTFADGFRAAYNKGLFSYIEEQSARMKEERTSFMPPERLPYEMEKYRKLYRQTIGMPQTERASPSRFQRECIGEDAFSRIYRITVTVFDRIPFYGLLFLPKDASLRKPYPLVIAQHGGGGTPGLIAGLHGKNNYQNVVQRALLRGAAVFAPQLLLWNMGDAAETCPTHTAPYDRTLADVHLKRLGMSLLGLEIHEIMESISCLSALPEIDGDRVGMMGLSYGGFYTLYTMAADTRISAGYSAAVFNDRDVYSWEDMTFSGSALRFQDAEVAALCAPRPLFVSVGRSDDVFDYRPSPAEASRVLPYYRAYGREECFRYDLWEGGHTFHTEGEGFDFVFRALGL